MAWLEVDFGSWGRRQSWDSVDDLAKWWSDTTELWEGIRRALKDRGSCPHGWFSHTDIDKLLRDCRQRTNSVDRCLKEGNTEGLRTALQEVFTPPNDRPWPLVPLPESDRGRYLKALVESGDLTGAAHALLAFAGRDCVDSVARNRAIVGYELYARGIDDVTEAQKRELDRRGTAWDEATKKWSEDARERLAEIELQLESAHDSATEATALAGQMDVAKSEFIELYQTEIDNIKADYRERMKLRAPVGYWKSEATKFAIGTGFSFVVLALVLGAAGWLTWRLFDRVLGAGTVPLAQYPALLAVLTVILWAVGICSRVFTSQLHLWHDARARVAMVQTYLAMIGTGAATPSKDQGIMLEALFREPTSNLTRGPQKVVGVENIGGSVGSG